jgi:hypothetical protein
MLVKDAKAITGGGILTGNGKMPGATYATDPFLCVTGAKLRKVEGTSCHKCYAVRIASFRPSVAKGYNVRHMAMARASQDLYVTGRQWVDAMVFMINRHAEKTGDHEFRWFDAGDVPHHNGFELIAWVAIRTPNIKHWIPTKENVWFKDFLKRVDMPTNMVVRVSTPKIDSRVTVNFPNTSTVHKGSNPIGHVCPASTQGNQCGSCRACWDPKVANVSYPLH